MSGPKKSVSADEVIRAETGLTPAQVRRLKEALLDQRAQLLARFRDHLETAIHEDGGPDEMDCATRDQEQAYLLRLADKERKLLGEVSDALARIEAGSYGICEGSQEAIGFRRLN